MNVQKKRLSFEKSFEEMVYSLQLFLVVSFLVHLSTTLASTVGDEVWADIVETSGTSSSFIRVNGRLQSRISSVIKILMVPFIFLGDQKFLNFCCRPKDQSPWK